MNTARKNYLKDKSVANLESAELLKEKKYFSPSVHCSYYSVVQLMIFILNEFFFISKDDIFNQQSKGGFHIKLKKIFIQKLKKDNFSSRDILYFTKQLEKLRKLRIKADYSPENIDNNKSKIAISNAKKLLEILNKIKYYEK